MIGNINYGLIRKRAINMALTVKKQAKTESREYILAKARKLHASIDNRMKAAGISPREVAADCTRASEEIRKSRD